MIGKIPRSTRTDHASKNNNQSVQCSIENKIKGKKYSISLITNIIIFLKPYSKPHKKGTESLNLINFSDSPQSHNISPVTHLCF